MFIYILRQIKHSFESKSIHTISSISTFIEFKELTVNEIDPYYVKEFTTELGQNSRTDFRGKGRSRRFKCGGWCKK